MRSARYDALDVNLPLLRVCLLGQPCEPLLEVFPTCLSVTRLTIVVLGERVSARGYDVEGREGRTGKKFLMSECATFFSNRSFLFKNRI